MKMVNRILGAGLAAFLCIAVVADAPAEDDLVSAKIGVKIKSGQKEIRAKARNRIGAGDFIRICVHPREAAYVYVVHSDGKTADLLNMTMQKVQSTLMCLPSMRAFYRIDGGSPMERIVVICSPAELPRLSAMIDEDLSADRWLAIEEELTARSEIELTQRTETTFGIAGNVRGADVAGACDPFVRELPIYSGKTLLVKTYAFAVQE